MPALNQDVYEKGGLGNVSLLLTKDAYTVATAGVLGFGPNIVLKEGERPLRLTV
jgi:hypothetical protein